MSKPSHSGRDIQIDITRHELPALRRPPLDERLPRLNCARQQPTWAPLHSDEKTLIGEIPALPLDAAAHSANKPIARHSAAATAKQAATHVPLDRWLLLAFAIGALGYSLHSALPTTAPPSPTTTPADSEPTPRFNAIRTAAQHAMDLLPAPEFPAAVVETPLDPTAMETAAAQAWLAGHVDEAAQLYEQLAALSQQAPQFVAAATILSTTSATPTQEPAP